MKSEISISFKTSPAMMTTSIIYKKFPYECVIYIVFNLLMSS